METLPFHSQMFQFTAHLATFILHYIYLPFSDSTSSGLCVGRFFLPFKMRMSCNGCRVLRKGCSDNCSIRPCLLSIKNPDAQANATFFLAKFYGRAGLTNLITAGPDHLRPAIFRSLLYEACGRLVNPIYGAVGLLWSGDWQHCQDAVEAVLNGVPIVQVSNYTAVNPTDPLKAYDIRHVSRDDHPCSGRDLHKISGCPSFKRSGAKAKPRSSKRCFVRAASHSSSISHPSKPATGCQPEESANGHSLGGSEETMEASLVSHGKAVGINEREVELELTLGFYDPQRSRTLSLLARTPPRMSEAVTLHL